MRAGEVLDAQVDLLERLDQPTFKRAISIVSAHHLGGMPVYTRPNEVLTKAQRRQAEKKIDEYHAAVPVFRNHVRAAYAYRVTHDMCSMVEWTASQLDDTDAFYKALLPAECGIVCFDKPLPLQDIRGMTMLVHWLIWGPAETHDRRTGRPITGTAFWAMNDAWRKPDEVQEYFAEHYADDPGSTREDWDHYMRVMGRWATVGMDIVFDDQRLGPRLWQPGPEQAAEIMSEGFEALPGTNAMRYWQALIILLGQTITTVADEDTPRPSRRRATKKGMPGKVSVITLRRSESEGFAEGESQVEWSHRWIVRRHPRWQPYGSRKGVDHVHTYGPIEPNRAHLVRWCTHQGCEAYLARIIINAYDKGPQDKPLVVTDKVYDLRR
jgi:hypothetical protein